MNFSTDNYWTKNPKFQTADLPNSANAVFMCIEITQKNLECSTATLSEDQYFTNKLT